jgi:hypothetical protein
VRLYKILTAKKLAKQYCSRIDSKKKLGLDNGIAFVNKKPHLF